MKIIGIIIVTLALAMAAQAQLIYSSIGIPVSSGTVCPTNWTSQTETIVVEARFYVHTPNALGGRTFLVAASFVNLIWPTDAAQAAAVISGVLEVQAQSAVTKNFCSLLP